MSIEYRYIPAGSVPTVALLLTRLLAATQRWWNCGGPREEELAAYRASHADDDFPSSASLLQIADGLGDLAQRVGAVDDRCDLPGFDELLEDEHVLVILLIDERPQLLANERGQHERAELAIGASEPPSSPFTSGD